MIPKPSREAAEKYLGEFAGHVDEVNNLADGLTIDALRTSGPSERIAKLLGQAKGALQLARSEVRAVEFEANAE